MIEVRYHEPLQQHMLYIDAGVDPADGAPLAWAREASPAEVGAWELGGAAAVEQLLAGQVAALVQTATPAGALNCPWWQRFWRWFMRRGLPLA